MTDDQLLKALAARAFHLRPGPRPGASAEKLETARFLLAGGLRAQVPAGAAAPDAPPLPKAVAADLARFFDAEPPEAARALLRPGPRADVHKGLAPSTLSLLPGIEPVAERPSSLLGPFLGAFDEPVWIGVVNPVARLVVRVAGDPRPLALFGAARVVGAPFAGAPRSVELEPGTAWLRARALAPAAPEPAYAGVRVAGGNWTLPAGSVLVGDTVTLPAGPGGTLMLRPEVPSPPAGPGSACAGVSITQPGTITLAWTPACTADLAAGGGATGFGTAPGVPLSFDPAPGAPIWDPVSFRVVLPAKPDPATFDAANVPTTLATLAGDSGIAAAGWALPATAPADPASLGEAAEAGSWWLRLADPVSIAWRGGPGRPASLPDARITLGAAALAVTCAAARPGAPGAAHDLLLWSLDGGGGQRVALSAALPDPFGFGLSCDAVRGEALAAVVRLAPVLDRPVSATGAPLALVPGPGALLLNRQGTEQSVTLFGAEPAGAPQGATVALENAYLALSRAWLGGLRATTPDFTHLEGGALAVQMAVAGWLPTLPDPYVASVAPWREAPFGGTAGGRLTARATWTGGGPAGLAFDGALGPHGGGARRPDRPPDRSDREDLPWTDTQTASGQEPLDEAGRKRLETARQKEERQRQRGDVGARLFAEASNPFRGGGAMLLDVSTRRHQIGVRFAGGRDGAAGDGFVVAGTGIAVPLDRLQIFALPQVQWEPVRTRNTAEEILSNGYFPTPLASADDGGPTLLAAASARLAPAVPDLALDAALAEFAGGRPVAALTTLPFGLRALLRLRPAGADADRATLVRPRFPAADRAAMEGAIQLSLESGGPPGSAESPSFAGLAVQTHNGVDLASGTPLDLSVLGAALGPEGSVETLFNQEFGSAAPRVPVTRLDLSGYGASSFSDWANPLGAFAQATKVQFQVMVGRTALEVVKFASVVYPWGRATRTVTIERGTGAGVLRRDSGWGPAGPWLMDFRWASRDPVTGATTPQPSPYTVHPGLLGGLFEVVRLRPTGDPALTLPGGGRVLPMRFDARARIEGLPGDGRTLATDVAGFLHLAPVGQPLTPEDLAFLIARQGGGIGGRVEAPLTLGGLRLNALRLEVGAARPGGGPPELVGCVRAAPVFGSNGSWAVARAAGPSAPPGAPPGAEGAADGAPLIRGGRAGVPTADAVVLVDPPGDLRLADPADLFVPTSPRTDYGLVQTTPTHSFAFRRPVLRAGETALRSDLPPLVADVFARCRSSALFPAPEDCIALTDRPYAMPIEGATGRLSLAPPVVGLANPRGDLRLSDSAASGMRLVYGAATLSLDIGPADWRFDLPGLVMWSDLDGLPEMAGQSLRVRGGSAERPVVDEIGTLMNGGLQDRLSWIPGFADRGPPQGPVDLTATNLKFTGQVKTRTERTMKLIGLLYLQVYAESEAMSELAGTVTEAFVGAAVGVELRGQTPPTPWFFTYGCLLELGGKSYVEGPLRGQSKASFELRAYIGFGYGGGVGPFEAKVLVVAGPVLAREEGDPDWRIGGFLQIEAKVDLVIASAKVFAEFVCLYVRQPAGNVVQFEGEVGIEVEVAWFLSISMSVAVVEERPA